MELKYLKPKIGKKVTVRVPHRLSPPFPAGTQKATGTLVSVRVKKQRAPRAKVDFGKKFGTHEVRTADIIK